MINPDISVIIPTYNRLKTLPKAIHSIEKQKFLPKEIIVVDDGSTDDTPIWLKSWRPKKTSKLLIETKHAGVSVARNLGIKKASSPWIAFLDSDDEWLPHKLEKQIHFMKDNPKIKIIHTEEIWIRRGIRVNPKKKHQKMGGHIYEQCLPLCRISPSSVLIHESVFHEVGNFDKSFPVCEDYDMWLRIAAKFEIGYIKTPCVIKHGGHEDQLSQKYRKMDEYRVSSLIKMLNDNNLGIKSKEATVKMLEEKCLILIQGAIKRNNETIADKHRKIIKQYVDEKNINF